VRNHLIRAARPENNEKADLLDPFFYVNSVYLIAELK